MQDFLFAVVLAGHLSLVSAKGGGGKGGGGGGGGSSSESNYFCPTCRSDLPSMYGHSYNSVFTGVEVIAMASITAFFLLILLIFHFLLRRVRAWTTRLAIWSLMLSLVFLIIRYILLVVGIDLPIGLRNESSIALLFWRLGFTILLIAISREIPLGKMSSIANIVLQSLLAIFNLTYIIMDFLVTQQAIDRYRAGKGWWLSDRDFGLTLSTTNIRYLATSRGGVPNGLTTEQIRDRMYDSTATKFLHDRGLQIKIGLIVDLLSLAVVTFLYTMAIIRLLKKKSVSMQYPSLVLTAVGGIFLSVTFRVITTTQLVLHNWGIVTDATKWTEWSKTYQTFDAKKATIPPTTFLDGYRIVVTGFPIVRAVIEPLGIVIACVAIMCVVVKQRYKPVNTEETKV